MFASVRAMERKVTQAKKSFIGMKTIEDYTTLLTTAMQETNSTLHTWKARACVALNKAVQAAWQTKRAQHYATNDTAVATATVKKTKKVPVQPKHYVDKHLSDKQLYNAITAKRVDFVRCLNRRSGAALKWLSQRASTHAGKCQFILYFTSYLNSTIGKCQFILYLINFVY